VGIMQPYAEVTERSDEFEVAFENASGFSGRSRSLAVPDGTVRAEPSRDGAFEVAFENATGFSDRSRSLAVPDGTVRAEPARHVNTVACLIVYILGTCARTTITT